MSSFTKFLIVLLTVFSIFLCGIVVTYVASANNWKAEYQSLDDQVAALKKSVASEKNQLKAKENQLEAKVDEFFAENTALKSKLAEIEAELSNVARDNRINLQRVTDSAGIMDGLRQTIEGLRTSLEATSKDLTDKTSVLASMTNKFNQINAELDNKIVELDTLSAVNKQLVEKNSDLEKMLAGKASLASTVTKIKDNVIMVPAAPAAGYDAVNLKALVSEVDLKNKLVTVTIGAADGVSQGMRFHVTRGDQFVGDVVITHVDQDKSAGVLELMQGYPIVGDNVSTSL